jgi:hypothetical protein
MGGRIWIVTNGAPDAPPLAFFSDRARAAAYRDVLVERYAMGRSLSLHGQPIADDAGTWQLGLGPAVLERPVDDPIDALPGAWCVKVDESLRMVACQFSTQFKASKTADRYRTGMHTICQAYGRTPHAALDAARKAMIAYLGGNHSWR